MELPNYWISLKLNELTIFTIGGDWGKDPDFDDEDFTTVFCIRGSEFRNWSTNKGSTASSRKIKISSLENRKLIDGDILVEISGGGPEKLVGRTVLVDQSVLSFSEEIPKVCTNFLRLLRTVKDVDSKFLNTYLSFFYSSGEIRDYQSGSNNLRNLRFNDYFDLDIPIPPISEQQRIIVKIEELFSKLDKGIENLKIAQQQLKIYRQSFLKYAFSGKLTEQWRANNQDKLEIVDELLSRIQCERDERYQEMLMNWEDNGRQGIKPKAPKFMPPLTNQELSELPNLPNGWVWEKLINVADLTGGVIKGKNLDGKKKISLPYLRVANVQDGYFNLNEIKFIDVEIQDKEKYALNFGDVLYTAGGHKDNLGRGAVWKNQIDFCIHQNHIFRARVFNELINHEILSVYSKTKIAKKYFFRHAKQTTNLASINLTVLANLPIVIFNKNEQQQFLLEIESNLSITDQLEQTITTALQQSEVLRQSILKKAFSGQLVEQDPNDEPASILLERIKAEKAALINPITKKTKSGKKTST